MKKFLMFLLSALSISICSKNIVFDLEGVLFIPDKEKIKKIIGENVDIAFVKRHLFSAQTNYTPYPEDTSIPYALEDGGRIPYLHYQHCIGSRTNDEILAAIFHAIKNYKTEDENLKSKMFLLAEAMYDPIVYTNTIEPLWPGIEILQKCLGHGHDIYILSNWAKESFDIMLKNFDWLSSKTKGMIISGYTNIIKPNQQIYQKLLQTYKLDPKETFFIDDREQNTKAAEQVGITGIFYKNPEFAIEQLKKLKIIE
jgi:HAD superfamily hydrolase (TIGR01509 family)